MPSLVNGREMNGYDYGRGPRINGGNNDGFDSYSHDPYSRDDMRRDVDYNSRGPRSNGGMNGGMNGGPNGGPSFDHRFNTDYLDQTSLSDFRSTEPKFELDHLATFAAGSRSGCVHAEDGLRKLRQMENTTGIWTMRCVLLVERGCLVILDNSTQEELERFPVQLVQDPTAIFKNDRREIYNNLILFTIVEDPKKRASQADMHIFQSCKAPAQEIVDEILAAQAGQQRVYPAGGGPKIPPPPSLPAPEPNNGAFDFQGMRDFVSGYPSNNQQTSYSQSGQFGGPVGQQRTLFSRVDATNNMDGGSNEILERDVQLLNHCFDDIEKFVARLQQAAESYKELEKRKRERGAKNKKRQSGGDGMLNARARPPPDSDFVDIFQKFKLSFNLLAKLKAHIHDPNAPELVHFLFTPLSLIYEASRDPYHGNQNLGDQAVAPVLTPEAKGLLLNCLTSKEIELWQALGKHWTTSRSEWNGHIPPYVPEFYDGWQPAASVIEEMSQRTAVNNAPGPPDTGRSFISNHSQRPMPFPEDDHRPQLSERPLYPRNDDFDRFDQRSYNNDPTPLPPRGYEPQSRGYEHDPRGFEPLPSDGRGRGFESGGQRHSFDAPTSRDRSPSGSGINGPFTDFEERPAQDRVRPESQRPLEPSQPSPPMPMSRQDENAAYFDELKRMGVEIYEAAHDRTGKNTKELTVQKGDVLQVMDNSKNWWKLRNYKKEVGFAPYTILKPIKTDNDLMTNGLGGRAMSEISQDDRRRGDSKYF